MRLSKSEYIKFRKFPETFLLERVYKALETGSKDSFYLLQKNFFYDEEGKTRVLQDDARLKVMSSYYQETENVLIELFNEEVLEGKYHLTYGSSKHEQKYVERDFFDIKYYTYLDGYGVGRDKNVVLEVKATTSRKFDELFAKINKKGSYAEYFTNQKTIDQVFSPFSEVGKYLYDLMYSYFVTAQLDKNKKTDYYIIVLNSNYVHGVSDKSELMKYYNVTSLLDYFSIQFENDVYNIGETLKKYDENPKHSIIFESGLDQLELSKESINIYSNVVMEYLGLGGRTTILDLINKHFNFHFVDGEKMDWLGCLKNGIFTIEDIFKKGGRLSLIQLQQYKSIASNKEYIDKTNLKRSLDTLVYPLYHLDFESISLPIPRFKGENPYTQSVFQYSLTIQEKDLSISDVKGYIIDTYDKDDRRNLVSTLLNDLTDGDGSIVVWNKTFEIGRLKEFIDYYPEFTEKIKKVIERIVDLKDFLIPTAKHRELIGDTTNKATLYYYHPRQKGSYSIKKVLGAFSKLDYKELDVRNGVEAQMEFLKFKNSPKDKTVYNNLKEYCDLDTLSMAVIIEGLYKKIKGV